MLLTIFRVTGGSAPLASNTLPASRLITSTLLPPTSWIFSSLDDYRLCSRRCLAYRITRLWFCFCFLHPVTRLSFSEPEIIELVRTLEMLSNSSVFFSFGLTVQMLPWAPPSRGYSRHLTVGTILHLTVRAHTPRRLLVGQKENSFPPKTRWVQTRHSKNTMTKNPKY